MSLLCVYVYMYICIDVCIYLLEDTGTLKDKRMKTAGLALAEVKRSKTGRAFRHGSFCHDE